MKIINTSGTHGHLVLTTDRDSRGTISGGWGRSLTNGVRVKIQCKLLNHLTDHLIVTVYNPWYSYRIRLVSICTLFIPIHTEHLLPYRFWVDVSCRLRLRSVPGGALTIGIYANFEAFDFADVKIITNCGLNKLYFMQYYTELYINAENPDLLVNK